MAEAYPLLGPSASPGPEAFEAPPSSLQAALQAAELGLTRLGVAFWCPERQEAWAWHEGAFPSASLIKLPLAVAALRQAELGALDLDERVVVPPLPEDDEAEWDDLSHLPSGQTVAWAKVLDRALTESDNAATNALIGRLGLGAIAPLAEALGLQHTALRRRMLDVAARQAGRDNTTSPVDMVRLMAALTGRALLEQGGTEDLMGWMGQQRHRDQMAPGLKAPWRFHHKTGELPGLRADAGWVSFRGGAPRCFVAAIAEGPDEANLSLRLAGLMQALVAREEALLDRFNRYQLWRGGLTQGLDPRLSWVQVGLRQEGEAWSLVGHSTEAKALTPPQALGLRVEAVQPVPKPMVVVAPALFLRSEASSMANLDDQGRYGDRFELLWDPELEDPWVFGRLEDGYLGWVKRDHLAFDPAWAPTHQLESLIVPVAPEGGPAFQLSAASRVRMEGGRCLGPLGQALEAGPEAKWRALAAPKGGPEELVAFARACLGLPYLWGGTTTWGLDCSGLVQLAHRLYGAELPRDADQQQAQLEAVADWRDLKPGDLCFFPGHVGLMVGPGRFIHATNGPGRCTLNAFEAQDPWFHPELAAKFTGGSRSPLARPAS